MSLKKNNPGCNCCGGGGFEPCPHCSNESSDGIYCVDIDGVVGDDCDVGACELFDGTYAIEVDGTGAGGSLPCATAWQADEEEFDDCHADANNQWMNVALEFYADKIRVTLSVGNGFADWGGYKGVWEKTFAAEDQPYDCDACHELTHVSDDSLLPDRVFPFPAYATPCDSSAATVTVRGSGTSPC